MITNTQISNTDRLRTLLNFNEGEGRQLSFLLLLFACLGLGMAIGRGSADALFLKRYGVDYLPFMYIALSLTLAFISTLYSAFVDRIAPEKFFQFMLLLQSSVLLLFWAIINLTELNSIFPAYYLLYEVISEIIVVHAAFYISQNLDTLQSKRLTPLIFAGYQSGMILGGIVLAIIIPAIGLQHAPAIWSVTVLCSSVLLFYWHKKKGGSPLFFPPSKSRRNRLHTAIKQVRQGIGFINQSPLLKDASLALFFMVIAFYAMSFSINSIYTKTFTNEAELAAFFGILLASTNIFALFLQIFVSGRVMENIGVRKTKLIFPLTLLASFIGLIVNPGLFTGIAASISKDSIMPAFRNPSRQMFFHVLPDYMKGRARATSVVIVLPIALLTCGLLILTLKQSSITLVYILGFFCAAMYLYFCHRMGGHYLNTLIDIMKERLFIPKEKLYDLDKNTEKIYQDLLNGLDNDDDQVSLSYARLLIEHYKKVSVDAVLNRTLSAEANIADQMMQLTSKYIDSSHIERLLRLSTAKDNHFKATTLNIIFNKWAGSHEDLIASCLDRDNERLLSAGICAIIKSDITSLKDEAVKLWVELVDGPLEKNLSSLNLIHLLKLTSFNQQMMIERYKTCIQSLLSSGDQHSRLITYLSLDHWQFGNIPSLESHVFQDISHHEHTMRAAAVGCLPLLESINKMEPHILTALDDGHLSVRRSAHKALARYTENPYRYYLDWITSNSGTPRAQTEIANKLIAHGTEHQAFRNIIESKIEYALKLASAIQTLRHSTHTESSVLIIMTTLEERLTQIIDLVLLLLQPLAQSDIIAVIRAALRSKDNIQVANACEAIKSMHDKSTVTLLVNLMDLTTYRDNHEQSSLDDTVTWCSTINDQWLQYCSHHALNVIRR